MKSAEEIIKERIPNGIVNVKAEGGGNGKPQYAAEIEVIKKCMEEYASQFKAAASPPDWNPVDYLDETQSVTNEGASTATLEELEKKVLKIIEAWNSPEYKSSSEYLWERIKPHLTSLLKEKDEKISLEKALAETNQTVIDRISEENDKCHRQIQELQSQLKEKDEKIKNWEKLYDEGTGAKEMQKQIQELRAWKESAMEIMSPLQDIGKALGIKLGDSIHDKILPAIKELKEQNELMQFGDNPIIQELKLELKEKDEFIRVSIEQKREMNDRIIKLESQLTNSREEAIGFGKWILKDRMGVPTTEHLDFDKLFASYLQSKTEQTNPIK